VTGQPEGMAPDAATQLRRAHLQQSLGRALASTRIPILSAAGRGLELGGAVNAYHAGQHLDQPGDTVAANRHGRPAALDQRSAERDHPSLMKAAWQYAMQGLPDNPEELGDLDRDNTALMAGALHQSLPGASPSTPLSDSLAVVQSTYGAWLAQGRPGGSAAERDYFNIVGQPTHTASPERLSGEIAQWAGRHNVGLNARANEAINRLYIRAAEAQPPFRPEADPI
jgi:hypothetical protein